MCACNLEIIDALLFLGLEHLIFKKALSIVHLNTNIETLKAQIKPINLSLTIFDLSKVKFCLTLY